MENKKKFRKFEKKKRKINKLTIDEYRSLLITHTMLAKKQNNNSKFYKLPDLGLAR